MLKGLQLEVRGSGPIGLQDFLVLEFRYFDISRYVLVVFMEKDTENEANMLELTKKFKQVKFLQVCSY